MIAMKGRLLVLTLLFTLFTGLSVAAGIFIWFHGPVFAGAAAGYFRMTLWLDVFFLVPTILLWTKVLKP